MTTLCFIDTETTGLDPRIHQPYEVCWWREDMAEPRTLHLPHSLQYAADVAKRLRAEGYDIPEPDHTAEGDVRTTRAVYEALRAFRGDA